jgi:DNA-binding transcriptional regulator PaaX
MRINKIQNNIFTVLKKVGEITSDLFDSGSGHRISMRRGYYYYVKRMENEGIVKKVRVRKKVITYALTEKGRKFINVPETLIQRTDGLSTIVIFDIPESDARKRTIFRRYLLRRGFVQLQGSVLISPNKIDKKTKSLLDELNIKKYTTIISGKIDYIY